MDSNLLDVVRSGAFQRFKELADDVERNIFDEQTPEENTVLHMAARFGHKDFVDEIVKRHPALVLERNLKGETAVHIAARAGQREVVKCFIRSVAKLSGLSVARIRDIYGNTPLHGAVRNGYKAVVRELASYDGESLLLINKAGESPLSIAIDMRFTEIAIMIINLYEPTLEFIGHNGQTALHYTVIRHDIDTINVILKIKNDLVRVQDKKLRTPLHYAAALGHQTMLENLINADPFVAYIADSHKQTPVHLAAKNDHITATKKLLDRFPDTIEMVDNQQRNILHLATEAGNLKIVKLILELDKLGDLVNAPDAEGNTPLHLATKNCYSDVVDVLSKNPKVEIRAINEKKKTALAIAKSPDEHGMELQKHLTWKALKVAYKRKGFDPDDILENSQLDAAQVETDENSKWAAAQVEKIPEVGEKSQQMAKRISFMSPLIATFTFTGAFTIPGGFKTNGPDEGQATLISKAAFCVFVISDTIAMISSIASAVITFWSISRADRESFMDTLPFAIILTWFALMAMTVAFVTGLFVVLQKKLWLAILVCTIGCAASLFLFVIAPAFLIRESRPNQRNVVKENPSEFIKQSLRLFIESLILNIVKDKDFLYIFRFIGPIQKPCKYCLSFCKGLLLFIIRSIGTYVPSPIQKLCKCCLSFCKRSLCCCCCCCCGFLSVAQNDM